MNRNQKAAKKRRRREEAVKRHAAEPRVVARVAPVQPSEEDAVRLRGRRQEITIGAVLDDEADRPPHEGSRPTEPAPPPAPEPPQESAATLEARRLLLRTQHALAQRVGAVWEGGTDVELLAFAARRHAIVLWRAGDVRQFELLLGLCPFTTVHAPVSIDPPTATAVDITEADGFRVVRRRLP